MEIARIEIPKQLLKKWEGLKRRGDGEAIIKASGIGKNDLARALARGWCSSKVFKAIESYYKEKEESIKKLISQ